MKWNCIFLEESLLSVFYHLQGAARVAHEFFKQHLTGITLCLTFLGGCIESLLVQGLFGLDAGLQR